ncbi:diguanylate cyclase domain-containing protein [Psychromonas antarctica]|uniref:diguanylate cyclase domain-containing protein n=1 Tax=Psychromonas antarctica TaxID=67573 RepID=UPI001EE7A7CF|nr:diguanylate cyclase [Psychromonas antarctica]
MPDLDIRTLVIVTALISLGSGIALIDLWRSQSRQKGVGFWATGMCCVAAGSILMAGRGNISDLLSLVVANSFYVVGFLLFLRGMRVFVGRPPFTFIDFGLPPIAAVLFYYFHYISPNINIRIVILSIVFVVTCFAIVVTLLREKNVLWQSAGFSVATTFGLFGLLYGARGVIALLSPFDNSMMAPSFSSSIVFLGGIFILGGIAITLTLLTYAVLESELLIVSLAVNQSASSIVITDTTGVIKYVNPACIKKTGYLEKELVGEYPRVLRSGEMPPEQYATLWETLSLGKTWRGEFHNRKKNGELFWEIASIAPVKQKNGKISHYVAIKEDITALKNAEERIRHLANHDVLTGLPSRRLSMDRLDSCLANARRNKTIVAVLFVDLDGFKAVNDTLGHDAGDYVLKETSTRLLSCVREVDTVGRVGGDEFWVILSNMPDKNSIITIAQKLVKAVAEPYKFDSKKISISASIGIALYPEHAVTPLELVSLADEAMYEMKRNGKNNYAFSDKTHTEDVIETM